MSDDDWKDDLKAIRETISPSQTSSSTSDYPSGCGRIGFGIFGAILVPIVAIAKISGEPAQAQIKMIIGFGFWFVIGAICLFSGIRALRNTKH